MNKTLTLAVFSILLLGMAGSVAAEGFSDWFLEKLMTDKSTAMEHYRWTGPTQIFRPVSGHPESTYIFSLPQQVYDNGYDMPSGAFYLFIPDNHENFGVYFNNQRGRFVEYPAYTAWKNGYFKPEQTSSEIPKPELSPAGLLWDGRVRSDMCIGTGKSSAEVIGLDGEWTSEYSSGFCTDEVREEMAGYRQN